jgi:hypothetical protein
VAKRAIVGDRFAIRVRIASYNWDLKLKKRNGFLSKHLIGMVRWKRIHLNTHNSSLKVKMLHSTYYFGFAVAIAVFPISFPKVANADVVRAGPYGGYYVIPGSDYVPNLDPRRGRSSSSSGRKYPGEYRFECERRLGYWEWEKRSEQYPFRSREDEYCNAMKENIKRSCRHLPNP